jgi:hypothetical protein
LNLDKAIAAAVVLFQQVNAGTGLLGIIVQQPVCPLALLRVV